MKSIWKASISELRQLGLAFKTPGPRQDLGDITVVCHTSNQCHLLQPLIDSARAITDKIIVLDDCSQDDTQKVAIDNGCRVYSVPEGWIYTHGFGRLITRSVELCDSGYYFQIDTGERLWVSPAATAPKGDYCWTIRINMQWRDGRCRQPMLNRIIRVGAPITMPALIHGSPREAQREARRLSHMQVAIIHRDPSEQEDSQYYKDRKNRLYWKLLRKGYKQNKLENSFWYNQYRQDKERYDRLLKELENKLGVLEETTEDIQLVHQGDW